MTEQQHVRRDVIVAMLPTYIGRHIHALIADAATVVAWIETGDEIKIGEAASGGTMPVNFTHGRVLCS